MRRSRGCCAPISRGAAEFAGAVFLGATGDFILSGFIGLFMGALVRSIGCLQMVEWMERSQAAPT